MMVLLWHYCCYYVVLLGILYFHALLLFEYCTAVRFVSGCV